MNEVFLMLLRIEVSVLSCIMNLAFLDIDDDESGVVGHGLNGSEANLLRSDIRLSASLEASKSSLSRKYLCNVVRGNDPCVAPNDG